SVPGRHQGLRRDECCVCDVFPEGSARALHGGRERACVGRAGGDRVPGGGGVARGGRPSYFPFTVRVDIQMSSPPSVPVRLETKSSVRPSNDRSGSRVPGPGETPPVFTLIGSPRFSGGDQGSCTLRRVDTQISIEPSRPARLELNRISRPSTRGLGDPSLAVGSFSSPTGTAGPRVSPSRVTEA